MPRDAPEYLYSSQCSSARKFVSGDTFTWSLVHLNAFLLQMKRGSLVELAEVEQAEEDHQGNQIAEQQGAVLNMKS